MLRRCCGSRVWVDRMMARRPYGTADAMVMAAREVWLSLATADWLEAFAAHPRIGDRASLAARFPDTAHLATSEQAGVAGAPADVLDALATGNAAYEARFGHIFIVCASGLSAEEMLEQLQARLGNDPQTELRIAAGEQLRITERRLRGQLTADS